MAGLIRLCLLLSVAARLCTEPAAAQAPSNASPDPASGFPALSGSNLLGDIGGLRPALARSGLSFSLQEISEVLGNLTGGIRQGAEYNGLTTMRLELDTAKAFGWTGGTFDASALQIHGGNLTANNLDTIQTASGIEADRATRLWELWYQQTFVDGRADVRLGQQSLDQEFIVSKYAALFINAEMGWPVVPTLDLYAGGPAYPLSSLGVRLRAKPARFLTVLAGVFDDNPPGGPFFNDSQLRDGEASGTRFNLGTGALFIAETQFAIGQHSRLPGTYKLGGWFDTATFPDQQFDDTGLSLAAPASTGIARTHPGNFSIYGIVDQTIWRLDPSAPRSLSVFARAMGAPGDRNLIDFGLNAGINLAAPLPGRPQDMFGIGCGLAKVSPGAAALDRATGFFTGTPFPVRSSESFVELTYDYQLAPWLLLQPDFQYVFNPGGGIPNPHDPTRLVGNEAIIGVRTAIAF